MSIFDPAARVADAVLREGHVLYPYRASAAKNRMRWQFGVLGPPALSSTPGADASWCETQVVCTGDSVRARVRFLRVGEPDASGWRTSAVEEHDLTDDVEFEHGVATLRRWGPFVTCRVENTSTLRSAIDREATLGHALVGVHVILATTDGSFISSVDPPAEAAGLVAACVNTRAWPVLVGPQVVLSCPIILYDNPEIAPESVGDWGDATEIEELLTLRVMTLTEEERRLAAATDPFARHVLTQARPERLADLHGRLRTGTTVELHPRPGADVHDMFLDGRRATVVGHVTDAEGNDYVQVLPDDDPGRDLHEWYGRSWFFRPDEVEPT